MYIVSVTRTNCYIQPSSNSIYVFRNVLLVVQICPQFLQPPLPPHAVYRFLHTHCKNKNERLYVNVTEMQTRLITLQ